MPAVRLPCAGESTDDGAASQQMTRHRQTAQDDDKVRMLGIKKMLHEKLTAGRADYGQYEQPAAIDRPGQYADTDQIAAGPTHHAQGQKQGSGLEGPFERRAA